MEMLPPRLCRDFHFDLSYLGDNHRQSEYTLRAGRAAHLLQRHTGATLRAGFGKNGCSTTPTHFAASVDASADVVQLARVYGPLVNGLPSLAAVIISTPGDSGSYSATDVARAVIFMNPTVTVLTPQLAETVLNHIGNTDSLPGLTLAIRAAESDWCTPQPVTDGNGQPVLAPSGKPYYTYELDEGVLNSTAPVSVESKTTIYSDTNLLDARWYLLPGVSHIDMNAPKSAAAGLKGRSGYHVGLKDGGPNFGISVKINGLSSDLVLDLTVTNSYIRHTSVSASFLKADGVTPMTIPDEVWLTLARGAMRAVIEVWLDEVSNQGRNELLTLLEDAKNTLKWCGLVGAEKTFMGIPVSSTNVNLTFQVPSDDQGPVGKIRLLVGSLGVESHNDWDPAAAWLGIALTALIDLAIPTFSLIATVGLESNTLFDSIFKDVKFLLPTAYSVYTVAKDLFTDQANLGDDLTGALTALADRLVGRVLTASDVAAKLAAYFGAEEVEEAIPFVGWALKAAAIEASIAQLAQTIGEVIGSPRVVEFDVTITMNAVITLVPDASTGDEFPATATDFTITAQYSGNTTRSYSGKIVNSKMPQLVIHWDEVPVGGYVTFVVALYDPNGWGVGKGTSATVENKINAQVEHGDGIFAITISVQQQLYPLSCQTSYRHSQLLSYGVSGSGVGYFWRETSNPPTETAENLGAGPIGHVLESLNGITISDDLGILGYSWEASGLHIPPIHDDTPQTELFTMQNIGFKPILNDPSPYWPQAGYMTAPTGYDKPPLLLYLRTVQDTQDDEAGPGFFFLDPTGDTTTGFHLRRVTPVTDDKVKIDDPSRKFDLGTGISWGRFARLPTSMAIHSNGYVAAVNPLYNTMQILQLPTQGMADDKAPWAFMPLGPGTAPGRVSAPTLAAIRPDQTILVLEAGNQRVQAFSRGGHPVAAFSGIDTPYWIPLVPHAPPESVVYLSMSADVAGYIYVLSQNGNGYTACDFYLDIYTPTGPHLVSQQGLVAAGLAVDLWRNAYTLNFQQIAGPGGRTEPSISEYIPSTPKPA